MSTVAVRPALPQDEIFLYDLYTAVRGPEFELAQISAAQREQIIRMQFRAQMSAYTQMYPNSCCHVVLLDSKPVGRLWVAPGDGDLQLVDIAIHPTLQSKGIGTVLIQRVQQEAAKARLPLAARYSASIPALCASIAAWASPSYARTRPTTTWNGGQCPCCKV